MRFRVGSMTGEVKRKWRKKDKVIARLLWESE